ncbi:MAG: cobalamin biosynthesis protein CobD [Candidatus Delongbacteria bacterium]|nr:cobalamin biosynthesis protein CobD [Candidatus Delongbacteria bacterium]
MDKILGDPSWLPHPIIWFGKAVAKCDKMFNSGKYKIIKGTLVTLFLVSMVFIIFYLLIYYTSQLNLYLATIIESIFIFYGIAGTTLIREGKAVFKKLDESLDAGRKQVSRIVGRDTSLLNRDQICAATLETMAENLSDGVIAPLFWYALAGIPGIMSYKMINTLDSMIGYKNDKYIEFGKFAAKSDDVANFIPARLTAFLMVIASGNLRAIKYIFKYGRAHSSPNAGYPEAALAGILNVKFGGTSVYFGKKVDKPFIGENQRAFTKKDIQKSSRINWLAEIITTLIILILIFYNKMPLIEFLAKVFSKNLL